jgi:hypothetical protein
MHASMQRLLTYCLVFTIVTLMVLAFKAGRTVGPERGSAVIGDAGPAVVGAVADVPFPECVNNDGSWKGDC